VAVDIGTDVGNHTDGPAVPVAVSYGLGVSDVGGGGIVAVGGFGKALFLLSSADVLNKFCFLTAAAPNAPTAVVVARGVGGAFGVVFTGIFIPVGRVLVKNLPPDFPILFIVGILKCSFSLSGNTVGRIKTIKRRNKSNQK